MIICTLENISRFCCYIWKNKRFSFLLKECVLNVETVEFLVSVSFYFFTFFKFLSVKKRKTTNTQYKQGFK